MKANVIDQKGKKTGDIELDSSVFDAKINDALESQALRVYFFNQRKFTAKTKTRGEVRGGGAKPWKQKGTGRARQGSRRSPIWVKGGVAFGPIPKDKKLRFMTKMRKASIRSAFSRKAKESAILVMKDIKLPETNLTKSMVEMVENIFPKLNKKPKITFITEEKNEVLKNACANIPEIEVLLPEAINIFELSRPDFVILFEKVIPEIVRIWKPRNISEKITEKPKKK